ncbi:hypothetical protein CPB86DRAFT_782801 [Serendipita vermifera]|nr:hypothetical protein CPB86DRAFT_782801 [Serendipita vermifera]
MSTDNIRKVTNDIYKRAERLDEGLIRIEWDCITREDEVKSEYAKARKKWADAAHQGDWDQVFKMIDEFSYDSRALANATRLLPKGVRPDPSKRPSGYTVLHQAAFHNASEDIAKALIALGCSRYLRTTDGLNQRATDIAESKGFNDLAVVLTPAVDKIPQVSDEDLAKIQQHFLKVVVEESHNYFKPETMKLPDLILLREVDKVWMPIPGMYGGFNLRFEENHLITESFCRVVGGSGRTNHITVDGATLVEEGWG